MPGFSPTRSKKAKSTAEEERLAERKRVDEFAFKKATEKRKAIAAAAARKKPTAKQIAKSKRLKLQAKRSSSFGFGSLLRGLGIKD